LSRHTTAGNTLRGHAQATSTSTTVGVTCLAGPDFMIEIEAVAIVNFLRSGSGAGAAAR
jgi:hypothetical protein